MINDPRKLHTTRGIDCRWQRPGYVSPPLSARIAQNLEALLVRQPPSAYVSSRAWRSSCLRAAALPSTTHFHTGSIRIRPSTANVSEAYFETDFRESQRKSTKSSAPLTTYPRFPIAAADIIGEAGTTDLPPCTANYFNRS